MMRRRGPAAAPRPEPAVEGVDRSSHALATARSVCATTPTVVLPVPPVHAFPPTAGNEDLAAFRRTDGKNGDLSATRCAEALVARARRPRDQEGSGSRVGAAQ